MYNTTCTYFKLNMFLCTVLCWNYVLAGNKESYPYLQYVSFHKENALFTEIIKI